MILSTLVTSQLHFEMCVGLFGHPVLFSYLCQCTRNAVGYASQWRN